MKRRSKEVIGGECPQGTGTGQGLQLIVRSSSSSCRMDGGRAGGGRRREHQTPLICRFFFKYKCFLVPILLLLLVHIILAISLGFLQGGPEFAGKGGGLFQSSGNDSLALDLSSLSFLPDCNITGREAVSAIHRARTQACKKELAGVVCKGLVEELYPKRLRRECPNSVTIYGRHLGCFRDDKKRRILPDFFQLLKGSNSPLNCVDVCLQSGFQYAGVEYGTECFCGNSDPSQSAQVLDQGDCNMKCPESLEEESSVGLGKYRNCGGYLAIDVFETGFDKDQNGKSDVVGLEEYLPEANSNSPEKPVKIVFFLTLNGRALRQVFRLIKVLFHENHYFYIHVDSRQDYLFRELLVLTHKLPNHVKFMTNRQGTIWGGASLLTVLLNGMKDLTNNARLWKWDWDYVINLSESDFPLKNIDKLEYFLRMNKGKNFLKSHGRDVQKFIQKQGLDKTFVECEYRMWRVGDRRLPAEIFIDGGSDWVALHRDFIEYAVNSGDELVTGLKSVFKYTLLPAESFFHTLLRNSEMCASFVDNNLHVTNWRRKLGCKCQHKNIVDWCGCSPNDFRLTDWNRLQMTEPRLLFFGRKFEAVVNQGIINQLEGLLYPDRFETNHPTLDRFWLSLYHHYDLSPKPDDALVTLGQSFGRIASKQFLSNTFSLSSFDLEELERDGSSVRVELLELTAYNQHDQLEGILARFQLTLFKEVEISFSLEAWFAQEETATLAASNSRTAGLQEKLQNLRVGSDYEQKEQIFRNFARALGPYSEPALAYSVHSEESFNITVAWVDPQNVVRQVSTANVSEGNTANFVKPTLSSPLLPGNWTVKVYSSSQDLLYRVKFLILPLEFYKDQGISASDSRVINSLEQMNANHTSHSLRNYIDSLVGGHYRLHDYCLESYFNPDDVASFFKGKEGTHNSRTLHATSLCSHTQWSSLFPDPKSSIEGINPKTGYLMP